VSTTDLAYTRRRRAEKTGFPGGGKMKEQRNKPVVKEGGGHTFGTDWEGKRWNEIKLLPPKKYVGII